MLLRPGSRKYSIDGDSLLRNLDFDAPRLFYSGMSELGRHTVLFRHRLFHSDRRHAPRMVRDSYNRNKNTLEERDRMRPDAHSSDVTPGPASLAESCER